MGIKGLSYALQSPSREMLYIVTTDAIKFKVWVRVRVRTPSSRVRVRVRTPSSRVRVRVRTPSSRVRVRVRTPSSARPDLVSLKTLTLTQP